MVKTDDLVSCFSMFWKIFIKLWNIQNSTFFKNRSFVKQYLLHVTKRFSIVSKREKWRTMFRKVDRKQGTYFSAESFFFVFAAFTQPTLNPHSNPKPTLNPHSNHHNPKPNPNSNLHLNPKFNANFIPKIQTLTPISLNFAESRAKKFRVFDTAYYVLDFHMPYINFVGSKTSIIVACYRHFAVIKLRLKQNF